MFLKLQALYFVNCINLILFSLCINQERYLEFVARKQNYFLDIKLHANKLKLKCFLHL